MFCFQLEDVQRQLDTAKKEQEATIELFAEERNFRDREENLKKKLRVSRRNCALNGGIKIKLTLHLRLAYNYKPLLYLWSVAGCLFHHSRPEGEAQCCSELPQEMKEQRK